MITKPTSKCDCGGKFEPARDEQGRWKKGEDGWKVWKCNKCGLEGI